MKLKCTKIALSLYPIVLLILLCMPIIRSVANLPGYTESGEEAVITNVYWLQPISYANIIIVILFFCVFGGYISFFIVDNFIEKKNNSLATYLIFIIVISGVFLACLFSAIVGGPKY